MPGVRTVDDRLRPRPAEDAVHEDALGVLAVSQVQNHLRIWMGVSFGEVAELHGTDEA